MPDLGSCEIAIPEHLKIIVQDDIMFKHWKIQNLEKLSNDISELNQNEKDEVALKWTDIDLATFKICKETKALSNYRKIEKYNLFKSAQKTWSTANC